MFDRGLHLTLQSIRCQLAGMPSDLYLVRLIHQPTRRAFPGERLWTATELLRPATVRFLRVRNREGCDVYLQPYADRRNPGYILVDLDHTGPEVLPIMQANGHAPCVVLQTSPGNLQVWVHVSHASLPPAAASFIGKQLAQRYGGDLASSDWRHLGRLAGFTNQKPQRRNGRGYAPWVKVLYARAGVASAGAILRQQAETAVGAPPPPVSAPRLAAVDLGPCPTPPAAAEIYSDWLHRLRIRARFPQPDWSIVDKWIAKELLRRGISATQVAAIVRAGSPGFPRRHGDPEDYLCRTLACAARELRTAATFPARASRELSVVPAL
jgi:RepB DNA-primase N-terminal domain/RepB DNA-primase C-terminal helical domain